MAGWVGVHLEVARVVTLGGLLQQGRAQGHDLLVRGGEVIDVQVEMDLLRTTAGPLRRGEIFTAVWAREVVAPPISSGICNP